MESLQAIIGKTVSSKACTWELLSNKGQFLLGSFPLTLHKAMHANNRYLGTSHSLGGLKWQSPNLTALAGTKLVFLVAWLPQKEEVWFCKLN